MVNYKHILYNLKIFERLHNVTKSIKLVAFTKFKKIQYRIKILNDSLISITEVFNNISTLISFDTINHLIVPVTSDKGCCGSINTHLMSGLLTIINSLGNEPYKIFLVGKKGRNFIKRSFKNEYARYVKKAFDNVISIISTIKINEEIRKIEFDKCFFLYNHFENINEQRIYLYSIFSYDILAKNMNIIINNNIHLKSFFANMLCLKYQRNKSMVSDLYDFIVSMILLSGLLDHELSELGGRITSMEKSSQNALEMFDSLQIEYNKARQSYITNQLIEICSASAAIQLV